MPYSVVFFLLNRDGSYRCALPEPASFALSPIVHEVGAVQLDYPVTGRNFAMLREHVDANTDVELAVWVDGEDDGLTALLVADDSDDVDEAAVWRFTGHFGEVRLEDAVIEPRTVVVDPPSGDAPTEDLAAYRVYSATAGTIMRTLLFEANGRGTLTDLDWSTFNNTTDSAGAPWSKAITLKIAPGVNYLEVLQALASYDLCEFRMVGRSLRMFNPGTSAVDHTVGPITSQVVLRRGRDITDAPRKRDVRAAATDLLLAGGEGLYRRVFDSTARARFGRQREQYRSVGSITDDNTLLTYGAVEMARARNGKLSITHGLSFARPDTPRPLVDFRHGDWVWSDTGRPDGLERLQVAQVTIRGDANGATTGSATLNDLVTSREAQLSRRVKGIEGGATLTGTSQARPVVDTPDVIAPAAPQGVAVTSEAQPTPDLVPRSAVAASWGEVVLNADGSVCDDLDHYVVEWRYLDPALVTNWRQLPPVRGGETASWSDVVADTAIEVRVLAVDRAGNRSEWSTPSAFHTTEVDGDPPPVPSALTVAEFLGTLTVGWDGRGALDEPMPADFDEAHIYQGTSDLFDDAVYLDSIDGAGQRNYPDFPIDVERFFWAVTVDRAGNTSDPSASSSGIPRLIGFADIAFSNPGNLVEDGSFELEGSRATHLARSDTGWSFVQGTPGELADHGEWFARATGSVGAGRRGLFLSGPIPIVPGDQLAMRFALRGVGANGDVSARIRWLDITGTAFQDDALTYLPAEATGVWLAKEVPNYTAPAGAVGYRVVFEVAENFTAGTWDVDRVEVREMIGTLLIRNAAITNAKIANLDVGKLTSGSLTAVVALLGTIRTAAPPLARVEITSNGFRKYDANNVPRVTITDTQTRIDGEIVVGDANSNSRVEIGVGSSARRATLTTYDAVEPNATTVLGQVYSVVAPNPPLANGLLVQRGDTGGDLATLYGTGETVGVRILRPETGEVALQSILGSDALLRLRGQDGSYAYAGAFTGAGMGLGVFNPGGGTIFAVYEGDFRYRSTGNSGTAGQIRNTGSYFHFGSTDASGGIYGFEYPSGGFANLRCDFAVQVFSPDGGAWRPIRASGFEQQSGAASKEDFTALPESALAVLRRAPVAQWRYREEPANARRHVGPIADDLPAWMTLPPGPAPTHSVVVDAEPADTDDDAPGSPDVQEVPADLPNGNRIDLLSMIGLLWDAVRDLDAELDEYRAERGRPTPTRRRVADLLDDLRDRGQPGRPDRTA